jgi:hypothetical protein
MLRKLAHPSVSGLDKDLTFRVQQHAAGEHGEVLRTISLNGKAEVARAAFNAAVKCYPNDAGAVTSSRGTSRRRWGRATRGADQLARFRDVRARQRAHWASRQPCYSRGFGAAMLAGASGSVVGMLWPMVAGSARFTLSLDKLSYFTTAMAAPIKNARIAPPIVPQIMNCCCSRQRLYDAGSLRPNWLCNMGLLPLIRHVTREELLWFQ